MTEQEILQQIHEILSDDFIGIADYKTRMAVKHKAVDELIYKLAGVDPVTFERIDTRLTSLAE